MQIEKPDNILSFPICDRRPNGVDSAWINMFYGAEEKELWSIGGDGRELEEFDDKGLLLRGIQRDHVFGATCISERNVLFSCPLKATLQPL